MSFSRVVLCALLSVGGLEAADDIQPTFPVPPGLKAELFASEPMFANPVAISVDVDGSIYVTETRRRKANALDIRRNEDWLSNDLSFTNVANKEAFYREQFTSENSKKNAKRVEDLNDDGVHDWRDLTVLSELVYQIRDTNGDGRADESTLFAEGFNTTITDVAAGILARGKDVYVTIAPDLWKLTDHDGDGRADERKSLAHGFAVHIAYAGHNMHGPIMGPDGRVYWSIGDIGSDARPHEGAIFRVDPDGQNFEVFARGLRNPHEFVFNQYGDMFTADNDSDNGDRERWLHIVEGADYGWRNSWQYQIGTKWGATRDTYPLWNSERLWHLWFPEQAAYILPPAAHVGPGPTGMKFYPGGALDDEFGNRILLAQFTGAAGSSTINVFSLTPNGATYDVASDETFLTSVVPTGIDFSSDGSNLFFADWAGGWDLNDRGRIWRLFNPQTTDSAESKQTHQILAEGFEQRSTEELIELLSHKNMNVRRESHFALADRGANSALLMVTRMSDQQLARIHALWALEMIHRRSPQSSALAEVMSLLDDDDPEIRAQAARIMGEGGIKRAVGKLNELTTDSSSRVRFAAAVALGKIGDSSAIPTIQSLLATNGNTDKHLRYAGIRALELIGNLDALTDAIEHVSSDVRLASAVALRRLEQPNVSLFLSDPDPLVVTEAARAINDVPLNDALPDLAAIIQGDFLRPTMSANTNVYEWIARRVLNANFRLGQRQNAEALAAFAADDSHSDLMRYEAVRLLADWRKPNTRDHVVGAWRPLDPPIRDTQPVRDAMANHLLAILAGDDQLSAAATQLASELGIQLDGGTLLGWVRDNNRSDEARVSALELLAKNSSPQFTDALVSAMNASSTPPAVYGAAIGLFAEQEPEVAAGELNFLFRYGFNKHIQAALQSLGSLESTNLVKTLSTALRQIDSGKLPPEIALDVVTAARVQQSDQLKSSLDHALSRMEEEPLGEFAMALRGGNKQRGRDVFFYKAETECLRCHKVTVDNQNIGGDAAPDLTGIGDKFSREYLMNAIVNPNKEFAEGYEQAVLTLKDESILAGRVLNETDTAIRLEVPVASDEDFFEAASAGATVEIKTISKAEITKRDRGLSGMPEGFGQMLTPFELRDLVEFLANQ